VDVLQCFHAFHKVGLYSSRIQFTHSLKVPPRGFNPSAYKVCVPVFDV
jgi:hypothetical protein